MQRTWGFLTRGRRRWYSIGAIAIIAIAGFWLGRGSGNGDEEYLTAAVERGTIRNSVAATGTIQAVLTVQVGSQVTGRIASLNADFNSVVKAGQVLARIDPANFDAQLERAHADLNDATAGVRTAEASVATQKANLDAAKVAAEDARRALTRARELATEGISSPRDLEIAEATYNEATARVDQSQAQVRSAEAAVEQSRARVDQAKAAVRVAEVNLRYTVIVSPVDGVVISRSVDVGQTVSASLQAPTIYTIANDLTRMQVVANVDEADIGLISPEARTTFTVDAFPGEMFSGSLNQIRLNPLTQQNVVTYSVIVDVSNPELKLRPGMTANTTFTIAERTDALRLPNAALRFWPEGIPREKEREIIAQAMRGGSGAPPSEEAAPAETAAPARSGGLQAAPPERSAWRQGSDRGERTRNAAEGLDKETGSAPASQLPAVGEVIRFPVIRRAGPKARVIWVLGTGGKPEPRVVKVGITDGSASEIVEGDLKAGETVIIGRNVSPESMAQQNRSPLGIGGPMRPSGKGGR